MFFKLRTIAFTSLFLGQTALWGAPLLIPNTDPAQEAWAIVGSKTVRNLADLEQSNPWIHRMVDGGSNPVFDIFISRLETAFAVHLDDQLTELRTYSRQRFLTIFYKKAFQRFVLRILLNQVGDGSDYPYPPDLARFLDRFHLSEKLLRHGQERVVEWLLSRQAYDATLLVYTGILLNPKLDELKYTFASASLTHEPVSEDTQAHYDAAVKALSIARALHLQQALVRAQRIFYYYSVSVPDGSFRLNCHEALSRNLSAQAIKVDEVIRALNVSIISPTPPRHSTPRHWRRRGP